MNKEKLNGKDGLTMAFLWIICFVSGLFLTLRLNIPPVLDEVGILANSAFAGGYDWSESCYTIGGYYYKYGVSVLYIPFLKLIDEPYILYKVLLSFNIAVYSFVAVIAYAVLKKHFRVQRSLSILLAAAAAFLPSCVLYQLYARADVLLIFLPWMVVLIMLELTETEQMSCKKRIILSILLSFCSVYAYAAHTRGLVVILAVFISLIVLRLFGRMRLVNIPAYVASTVIFLIADKLVSGIFYEGVYGIYGTQHASVESFEFSYLKKLFSGHGIATFIKQVTGWLFDGMTVTYGMIFVGILGGFVLVFRYFKNGHTVKRASGNSMKRGLAVSFEDSSGVRRISDEAAVFSVFSVFNFLGAFGMGIIFFFPVTDRYYLGEMLTRSDRLVYERYMSAAFGPVVLLAVYLFFLRPDIINKWIKLISVSIFCIVTAVFFLKCVQKIEGVQGCARNYLSLSTFLKVDGGTTNAVFENITGSFAKACIFGGCIFALLILVSFCVKKVKIRVLAGTMILFAASVFVIISCYDNVRLSRDEVLCEWTKEPAAVLIKLGDSLGEYPVLWDGSAKDIKHYQYQAKKYVVGSYCTDTVKAANCFIIAKKNRFIRDYYDDDYYLFADFDYENATRDIIYVKGRELCSRLEELGWKMIKYDGKLKNAVLPDEPQPLISRSENGN